METSGFFTAELQSDGTYDRVYVAEQFAKYFSLFVGTGVFVQPASQLMVVQSDTASMKVKVKSGNAFIKGYWYNSDGLVQFTVPTANGALDRWDAIVLRHDLIDRTIRLAYKTGTPAITPSKPQPERSHDAYEICLAHIFVGRGVLKITDANITDTRPDSSICGYVKGLVETVNTTDLFAQFRSAFNQFFDSGSNEYKSFVESMKAKYGSDVAASSETYNKFLADAKGTYDTTLSEYFSKYNTLYTNNEASFNTWFNTIKGKLGADIAGSLQNQIDSINNRLSLGSASGSSINLPNSFNGGLSLKELQGKSVQNGVPSPTNKVDIKSVGDDGSVVVRVTGKNMLPSATPRTLTNAGITTVINQDGTFTSNGTSTTADINNWLIGAYKVKTTKTNVIFTLYPNNTYYINDVVLFSMENDVEVRKSPGVITVSPTEFPNGIRVTGVRHINVTKDTILTNKVYYPRVEVGSTATTYEPYKGQLITIPLTQPLRSVGDIRDRIIKKDGVWGVERKFGFEVFDGSSDEKWARMITNTTGIYRFRSGKIENIIKRPPNYNVIANMLCNSYPTVSTGSTYGKITGIGCEDNGGIFIYDPNHATSEIGAFTSSLASKPITLIYELATPTFEPFTQSIQDQLNKLQTYQGVTNVFTTDPLQPNMTIQYGNSDADALALYGANVVDSKVDKADFLDLTATITPSFTGSSAPYTQTIPLSDIKATDKPMVCPVYSSSNNTAVLQKKAWSCIDEIDTADGSITVKCFSKKPVTEVQIQLKVVRG